MKRLVRPALICVATLAMTAWAGAQETVPFEFELPVAGIDMSLFDCRIEVVNTTDAQPLIRAFDAEGSVGQPATFEVVQTGGSVRISRIPPPNGAAVTTAIVEVVLDPGQPLSINGRGLSLTVRGEGKPPQEASAGQLNADTPAKSGVAAHTFELTDSEAALHRAPSTSLRATNSAVHTEEGFGTLTAELAWSNLTVRGHEGHMQISSEDSETVVERLTGDVEFTIVRGGLDLRDGSGSVRGDSQGGRISFDHWEGSASVTGTDAAVGVFEGSLAQFTFTGVNSDLTLDGVNGDVKAELQGGDGSASSTRGKLDLTATDNARVTCDDLQGPLGLVLRDGSEAEVRQALGGFTAKIHSSVLLASGVSTLELVATESRVTADDVQHLTVFKVSRSDVELDLSRTQDQKFNLKVPDETYVRVSLYSPCRVRVRKSADGGKGVNVTGCELQIGTTGKWRGGQLRSLDGRPPFMLIADVGDNGQLRVQGGP